MTRVHRLAELDALASRKQVPGESVDSYLTDIHQRCMRLQRDSELEFEHALQGLQPNIKKQVLLQQVTTIDDIRRIGQLCELVQDNDSCRNAIDTDINTQSVPKRINVNTDNMDLVASLKAEIHRQQQTINNLSAAQSKSSDVATTKTDENRKCTKCGRWNCKGQSYNDRQKCRAYNKTCNVCNKLHHFGCVCRSRKYLQKNQGGSDKPQASATSPKENKNKSD